MDAMEDEVKRHILDDGDDMHRLVIMLAYACDERPVRGKTKMQKMVYMLSRIGDKTDEMGFYPDMHGPYSEILDGEMRYLNDLGILSVDNNKTRISDTGREVAKHLADADLDMFETVERYKEMFNDMSTNEVLTYVYLSCPAMTVRSPAYKELEPHMEKHVMSMLRKEKISSGKAAELLDKSREEIIDKAVKNGIQVMGY